MSCCSICGRINLQEQQSNDSQKIHNQCPGGQSQRSHQLLKHFCSIYNLQIPSVLNCNNNTSETDLTSPEHHFYLVCTSCTAELEKLIKAQKQMELAIQKFNLARDLLLESIIQSLLQKNNQIQSLRSNNTIEEDQGMSTSTSLDLIEWTLFLNEVGFPTLLAGRRQELKLGNKNLQSFNHEDVEVFHLDDLKTEINELGDDWSQFSYPVDHALETAAEEDHQGDHGTNTIESGETGVRYSSVLNDYNPVVKLVRLRPDMITQSSRTLRRSTSSRKKKQSPSASLKHLNSINKKKCSSSKGIIIAKTKTKVPKVTTTLKKGVSKLTPYKEKRIVQEDGQIVLEQECRICKRIFNDSHLRGQHEAGHFKGDTKYYNCAYCTRIHRFRGHFLKHLQKEHSSAEELQNEKSIYYYYCDAADCDHCFPSKALLEAHMDSKHESSTKFHCKDCDKILIVQEHFANHQLHVHQEYHFDCIYCHLSFESQDALIYHSKIHEIYLSKADQHVCDICGNEFVSNKRLSAHVSSKHRTHIHNNDVRINNQLITKQQSGQFSYFTCNDCGKTFSSISCLKSHSYEHMANHPGFPCPECDMILKTPTALSRHKMNVHRRIQCRFCGKGLWTVTVQAEHEFKCHYDLYMANKPFYCKVCYQNFVTEEELVVHQKIHEQAICKICGLQCNNARGLLIHKRAHYIGRNEPEPLKTNINVDPDGKDSNNSKFDQHGSSSRDLTETTELDKVKTTPTRVISHSSRLIAATVRSTGTVIPPRSYIVNRVDRKGRKSGVSGSTTCKVWRYPCKTCGKTYAHKQNLKDHENTHLPKDQQQSVGYICHICGKSYKIQLSLYHHVKNNHEEGNDNTKSVVGQSSKKKYSQVTKCMYCNKNLCGAVTCKRHMLNEHKEQYLENNPFYCQKCCNVFKTEEGLNTHLNNAHFKCQFCGCLFLTKVKHADHENTHTGNKPYHCNICDKNFSSEPYFNVHKKIHQLGDDKPYQCEICPTKPRFHFKCYLTKHEKIVHRNRNVSHGKQRDEQQT